LLLLWSVRLMIAPHGSVQARVIRRTVAILKNLSSLQQSLRKKLKENTLTIIRNSYLSIGNLWIKCKEDTLAIIQNVHLYLQNLSKKLKENTLAVFDGIKNPQVLYHNILNRWKEKPEQPKISWSAYSFYRFKIALQAVYASRLDTLQNPRVPGKVSVILPVLNAKSSVGEAITGVLGQTYENLELIVVSDGSCDQIHRAVSDIRKKDSRVKLMIEQDHRLSAALNRGFRRADGEFFTWLRAESRIRPDFFEKLVACLQRHPNVDMVYANMNIVGEHGQILHGIPIYLIYQNSSGSQKLYLPPEVMELNVVPDNFVGVAFLYRSRMDFLLGDYSLSRCGAGDYDYWMRINAMGTIQHSDFPDFFGEYPYQAYSLDREQRISPGIEGLMVYEDARRDVCLAPAAWIMEAGSDLLAQAVTRRIRAWIAEAKHVLLDSLPSDRQPDYRWWLPLVAVRVVSDLNDAGMNPNWPEHAFKVLVQAGSAPLPPEVSPDWDLCVSAQEFQDPPPRLSRPRQGWLAAHRIGTLCSVIDIRVKQAHLTGLEDRIHAQAASELKFSVVICTYHRGVRLSEAILSVVRQSIPQTSYEVIIVNNDPADTMVSDIVNEVRLSRFAQHPEQLREISCPFRGISFARNAGIAEARGKIVSFLDDDAAAFPDWLEQVDRAASAFPLAGVIGGSILLDIPKPRPYWLREGWGHYWSHFQVDYREPRIAEDWGSYPWGANWSALRQALLEIGGFRTKYGRSGSDFAGGEEVVAAFLIRRLGYEVVVAPAAQVCHKPGKERYTLKHIYRTIQSRVNTCYQMQIDLYAPLIPKVDDIRDLRDKRLAQAVSAESLRWHFRLEHLLFAHAYGKLIRRMHQDLVERERLAEARMQAKDVVVG
jgi:O-antigen biosynthesis protein